MRSTRLRLAAVVSSLAVFGLLGTAQGATTPSTGPKTLTIADPTGDEKGGQASLDATKVLFTTTGTTTSKKVKGKTVKSYTPTALVVQLVLAAAPTALPTVVYEVDSVNSICGNMYLYFDPQLIASGGSIGCGPPDAAGFPTTNFPGNPVLSGSTITWTWPFSAMPPEFRVNSTFTDVHSYIALADPITGASPGIFTAAADFDDVDSGDVYKVG